MSLTIAQQMRQVWIDSALSVGPLRRASLMAAFEISSPQASNDLKTYREAHPKAIEYDLSAKCYRRPERAKPVYPMHLRMTIRGAVKALQIFNEQTEARP